MKGKAPSVEEAVRIEAYLLSEKAGHPGGMESYFWQQARGIVAARKTAVAGAVKKAAASKTKAKVKPDPKKTAVTAKPEAVAKKPEAKVKPKAAPAKKAKK